MELFDLNTFGCLQKAVFLSRPNRFVGHIQVDGRIATCHIADTGRLREILHHGREILVTRNPAHLKTAYRLLAARMDDWVLINTAIHSRIVRRALEGGVLGYKPSLIVAEVQVAGGRLDYLVDDQLYIEVKGTNLLKNGQCLFPDAPTTRGRRHLEELIRLKEDGYDAMILLLGLQNGNCFRPHHELDPEFANTFRRALSAGVRYQGLKLHLRMPEGIIVAGENLPLCPRVIHG